ncbi:C-terminal processing protease CtpA/Prc [Novosphingobium chloroacetimidivorans]|uniref:C-terminal processing protease CtpA/Prc n=1 Tax=Novosphingobium chloroacetimidivorans TaxID=1428314 RepID=A0A7W7NYG1_9SPHN|nr:S41 family peptidase [Novosphingobium chloroacetimidivorans]MBB4860195.1 C-terminal processing protease CtpA/Prc [Novosphingobium chloroacetimidivorans]
MPSPSPTASPAPTPTSSTACTLRARQDWALAQLNEWYLFPELLATDVNPAGYSNLDDYVDALVAPARAQQRDRYFTHVSSIAEENAFYENGTSAGLGVQLQPYSDPALVVVDSYEGAPGLAAGLDRGTEILSIGTSSSNLRTIRDLVNAGGWNAVYDALGPDTAGTTVFFQIRQPNSTVSTVSVTKRSYDIPPISSRFGTRIIDDGGRKVGYINLRTFVVTADRALREAFASFKAQGVTEVIVDLRYNGGGLISVANLFSDLLNAQRVGQVLSYEAYRPSKASRNVTNLVSSQAQAIAATKVAFIGTDWTASASELVINAQRPYLGGNVALIGSNTYGKPVGQVALDRPECDDRLRAVAIKTENSAREGDYYTGLASKVAVTCQATDDVFRPLGDTQEASIRTALNFLAGRSCTPIQGTASAGQQATARSAPPLIDRNKRNAAQREVPGLF